MTVTTRLEYFISAAKLEAIHKNSGLPEVGYVGVKFSDPSILRLHKLIKQLKLPNPLKPDQLHITIAASKKPFPFKVMGLLKPKRIIEGPFFFKHYGDNLVLEFDDAWLNSRHAACRKAGALKPEYPFKPHITLSYNAPKFEVPSNFKNHYATNAVTFTLVEEYSEDYEEDWAS